MNRRKLDSQFFNCSTRPVIGASFQVELNGKSLEFGKAIFGEISGYVNDPSRDDELEMGD